MTLLWIPIPFTLLRKDRVAMVFRPGAWVPVSLVMRDCNISHTIL